MFKNPPVCVPAQAEKNVESTYVPENGTTVDKYRIRNYSPRWIADDGVN
ncbi:MAG: hypothetical protein Q8K98_01425 [Bacteroidota bacterium]|nr:hypothetical protein [Bacteroidota bacterium]